MHAIEKRKELIDMNNPSVTAGRFFRYNKRTVTLLYVKVGVCIRAG